MNKEEYIAKYGNEAYEKMLEQNRARVQAWDEAHPELAAARNHEMSRKGGKRYEKKMEDQRTGLQGEKQKIQSKHAYQYSPFKNIIAPESQIHHEWIPRTAEYRGLALVEADQHIHGYIDVIQILDGKITVLTEEEVRKGKKIKEGS